MIIVSRKDHPELISQLQTRFAGSKQVFVNGDRIALLGVTPQELTPEEKAAAATIIADHPAAVRASRLFHPEDTVIATTHSRIGSSHFTLMAGPCLVESAEHVLAMAAVAKRSGATVLRGGAFKPRTSPYSFQGLGEAGLQALRRAADQHDMDVLTEVMAPEQVALTAQYADILQIGARNMQNFALLKAVGQTRRPVMLKRGLAATIDDVLNAVEYILAGGNSQVMITERGIRTFDNKYTRNTLDVGAVPVLQKLTHLPVIIDPSHAAGHTEWVTSLALAGTAAGASGLVVEIHDHPAAALSDGAQALLPEQLQTLAQQVQRVRTAIQQA
ncbi:3-deoxy-7-phosphoheptulonate synthase [Limosilactobacillus ingluviei]|uniref:3-deoxy-7-phosphoheptulonate synthase n=1 Tax=Limosilactobacillus ingluviei TaxID=148604 RepID=UPI00195A9AB5|nr:3-deoxy-7-phosphoheptulonate synthase [Limosilactobacillus ingluviei]MBM6728848.1 3-deoxy-7-phosphoheptulonate synthase [Limosilactobacillus ingluviei]